MTYDWRIWSSYAPTSPDPSLQWRENFRILGKPSFTHAKPGKPQDTYMLTAVEKVIFLQHVDVFSEISTEQMAYLAAIVDEVSFPKDTDIYHEQDPPDAIYLVLEGKVRLHRNGEDIAMVGPKEAFGTWALFDEEPRVATATTSEDSRLLRVSRDGFIDLLSDHVQITQGVLRALTKRLRGLIGETRTKTAR